MKALILALTFLMLSDAALAGPIVAAAIAGQAITAIMVAEFAVSLAIAAGASYVAGKLLSKPTDMPTPSVGGVELDIRIDAGVPRSLLVGTAVTAGSLVYVDTYGKRGTTANSDAIEIIALADHPCEELLADGVFVDGKQQAYTPNLADDSGGVREGMRIQDYKRKLFFKFYDGTQAAADALAVAKLDGNPAWTAAMIGQGVTYVRVHAIYHATLVTSLPQWKFVVKGIKLYDPRKDTTVGGSGAHRFTNLSTHEWTDNPIVIAYNILRGIYVADGLGVRQHFYGLKRTVGTQLPFDEWVAAMNACDEDTSATDTTARYRAGGEISVDTEPFQVIMELLKSCGGKMTELGGVYKPYVDAPGLPDFSFTDEDILDAEDRFHPVLPLEQRVNYITGSYTHPVRWSETIAPPREDAAFEVEDGRRLPAELTVPMVQYGRQWQRLAKQYLKRARRGRKHIVSLPPRYFGIESGKIGAWDSPRNGYSGKLFEVDGAEYHGNLCVTAAITEVDPTDFDAPVFVDEDEDPFPSNIPDPKAVENLLITPTTDEGDDGTKRPAFRVTWDAPEDLDVSRLAIQIRRTTVPARPWSDDSTEPEGGEHLITGKLQPNTNYDLRVRFESQSGYDSDWTDWAIHKTLNVKLTSKDFDAGLKDFIDTGINNKFTLFEDADAQLNLLLNALQSDVSLNKTQLTQMITSVQAAVTAAYTNAITVATRLTEPKSAIGQALTGLEAQVGDIKANTKAQFVVGVSPITGAIAAYDLKLVAEQATAGMTLVARQVGAVKTAQVLFDVDSMLVGKSGQVAFNPVFVLDTSGPTPRILFKGEMLALSLKAARAFIGSLSAINANLGTVTAGRALFNSSKGEIDINSNPLHILISKWVA